MKINKLYIIVVLVFSFFEVQGRGLPVSKEQYFSPMRLETAVEGMAYPFKYEDSKQAYRMEMSFNRNQSLLGDFQWSLDANLWVATPQEVAHWFNVPQANITYRTYNWFLSLGRYLPPWGGVSYYSPIQHIFPTFNIDPLNYEMNGLTGLYAAYETNSFSYEFFYNPLFLPHSGGARYETEEDGSLLPASRWVQPLYYSFKKGEILIPLKYKLGPIDFKDILFQNSFTGRVSYQSKYFDVALAAAYVVDPEARLKIDPKLKIVDEKDLETIVKIYPEFFSQKIYGVEAKIRPLPSDKINLLLESAYIDPENPSETEKSIIKNKRINNMFGISYWDRKTFLKSFSVGVLYSKEFEDDIQPQFIKLEESNLRFFSNAEVQILPKLSMLFFAESDFELDDTALKTSLLYKITNNIHVGGGIDIVKGAPDTYWGQFGSHDRMWLKVQYVF